MKKEDIKIGKLTEQELVQMFGSDAQKKSYAENEKFIGTYKSSLMKKAVKYCDVKEYKKENGRMTYKISQVYDTPLPSNFNKMNTSLYKYIVPLVLDTLVFDHDKNNSIEITVGKWAREINMVNHNYNLIKYNREDTSKEFQIRINEVNEFFDKADHMINWYIENALDYLKSAGLIIWREVNRVTMEESDGKSVIDENGNVEVNVNLSSHQASKEEMEYYSQCIAIADKEAGIENAGERYYSQKAKHYKEILKRELYKRKIKYIYSTYEAYYVHLDRCQSLLKQFNFSDRNSLVDKFNKEFSEMMIKNAGIRFDKNVAKYLLDKEDYILSFKNLCEITIDNNTEYMGKRIREKNNDDNYNLQITHNKTEDINGIK